MPCEPTRIDETLQELNAHGTAAFPFEYCKSEYDQDYDSFPWHWHREFEIVLIERGETHCMIGSHTHALHQGEGLFIQPGVIHSYETPRNVTMPAILFLPEFIAPEHSAIHETFVKPVLLSSFSHIMLCPEVPWQQEMLACVAEVNRLVAQAAPTLALDEHAAVCRLWSALFPHLQALEAHGSTGNAMLLQTRLRRMIDYIETHFAGNIRLEDIARVASVSVSEALRCFRDGVHTTPIGYLNRFRLNYARTRLLDTAQTITDIAAESGFGSPAYFDRLFLRAFHMSPKEYRKVHGR